MSATTNPPEGSVLPTATIGTAYSQNIGVNLPSNDSIIGLNDSGLPNGLSAGVQLGSVVRITGTPTGPAGNVSFSIPLTIRNSVTGDTRTETIGNYTIPVVVVCVAPDTQILMADGTTKQIQDIVRGDWVSSSTQVHRVARVLSTKHTSGDLLNMVVFNKDSVGTNLPSRDLIITSLHPIVKDKQRVHAIKLANLDRVNYYHNVPINRVTNLDKNGEYTLWDLQFETVGSYIANGLEIQSRHPRSFLTPLPKNFYFNQSLYTKDFSNDFDPKYPYPLVN